MGKANRIRIGRLEVDLDARRVSAGEETLSLQAKVFDLLAFMARHPGEALSHDRLLEEVWGRSIASDSVIAVAVKKLRNLLEDAGGLQVPVATLRGVGYRLDAEVEWLDAPDVSRRRVADWRLAALAAVALAGFFAWWQVWQTTVKPPPRIALLELENVTGETELEWVRAGAAALIAQELASRGVEVISPQQIRQLREAVAGEIDALEAAVTLAGADDVYAPRLLPDAGGYRLEMHRLGGRDTEPLVLAGSNPASLSLAMAGLMAEQLRAPLPKPRGAGGLGSPFLNEAYARAFHHMQLGDFQSARELYEYILREAPQYHWANYQLAILLNRTGEIGESRAILEGLMATELHDAWLEAAVLTTMGNNRWYAGDRDEARGYYLDARQVFETSGMNEGLADIVANLGMLASSQSDFETGEQHMLEALSIYRGRGNRIKEARLLHNLGNSFFERGDEEQALAYLQQAHAIRAGLGLRDQAANTLSVMGEVAIGQGRITEGVALLEQVLEVYAETGNERGRGIVLADLAHASHRQGDYRRARELATQSMTLARTRGEQASIAQTALYIGRSLHALDDFQGAEQYFREAAAAYDSIGNEQGVLVALSERIRLALDRGDPDAARTLLEANGDRVVQLGHDRLVRLWQVLEIRERIVRGEADVTEASVSSILEYFPTDSMVRADVSVEIARSLHASDPGHRLLAELVPTLADWAPRHYASAHALWWMASETAQCDRAAAALKELRGDDWRENLPPSPLCTAAP